MQHNCNSSAVVETQRLATSHAELLSQHRRQLPPSSAASSLSLMPQVALLALEENRTKFQLHYRSFSARGLRLPARTRLDRRHRSLAVAGKLWLQRWLWGPTGCMAVCLSCSIQYAFPVLSCRARRVRRRPHGLMLWMNNARELVVNEDHVVCLHLDCRFELLSTVSVINVVQINFEDKRNIFHNWIYYFDLLTPLNLGAVFSSG